VDLCLGKASLFVLLVTANVHFSCVELANRNTTMRLAVLALGIVLAQCANVLAALSGSSGVPGKLRRHVFPALQELIHAELGSLTRVVAK
jgi:hypothetical protein